MPISEGAKTGVVGQEGFILVAIAEDGINAAARKAMMDHDRLEVRLGIAPIDLTWH
jgi:hypothetical protein